MFATHTAAQVITTVAGTQFSFPSTPLPAISAPLGGVKGVATDSEGNVYVADTDNNLVLRFTRDGKLDIIAGNGTVGFSGDGGPATSAALSQPKGVAVDAAGNVYISGGSRIRKVSGGVITTIAGNGASGFSGDGGPSVNAEFNFDLGGLAVDSAGNVYVADANNDRIRKVSSGIVTTIAGSGTRGLSGDGGTATSAWLSFPQGVAVDSADNVFIADIGNHRIRKVAGGIITTIARSGPPDFLSGVATSETLSPAGVAVDSAGNVYIADAETDNYRIRKVFGGIITTITGIASKADFSGDGGPAASGVLNVPTGVAVDSAGNVYIADSGNLRIRKVSGGIIATVAGNGGFKFTGDGGPATSATLNQAIGVAVDSAANVYIADQFNQRIRKVSGGTITTIAGSGILGFSGDGGAATRAALRYPSDVAVDSAGNVYIADGDNRRIRKVSGGIITTIAGNGTNGFSGDGGPATAAALDGVLRVVVDSAGSVYISGINRIRKVSGGIITTVAGNGTRGFSGDGGPATSAAFSFSAGNVAVDSAGNLYIADQENDRIRRVSGGIVTTIVGSGMRGFSGDGGPATSATLFLPQAIAVDSVGNVYIADGGNLRIRKVSGGVITTVAGNGKLGFSGDGGPPTSAALYPPQSLALDSAGSVYVAFSQFLGLNGFADSNNRIRKVQSSLPRVQASPAQLQFAAASAGAIPPAQTINFAGDIPGVPFSVQSSAAWLKVFPQDGMAPRLIEVTTDPGSLQPGTYKGTIIITSPFATPQTSTVAVTFDVQLAQPPKLAVDTLSISFPFPRNGRPLTKPIQISNRGGGTLVYTVKAATNTGGPWLSAGPFSGNVLPSTPTNIMVRADPAGLSPGTYTGSLIITGSGDTQTVPATLTVSTANQSISLSQAGLSFLGVSQGGILPPQTFAVLNTGNGVVNWTVRKSTLSGNDWLQIGTTSGSSDALASNVPNVIVTANAAGLPAGKYYGLVQVDAPNAANSPQVITVFLQVFAPQTDLGAVAEPAEVLFASTAGSFSPSSQDLLLYNITATPKSFRAETSVDAGIRVVTLPADGTLDPQQATRIVLQPFTDGAVPGIYNGTVTLQFSDGRVRSLKFSVVVASAASATSTFGAAREAAGCTPTKLLPALANLGQSFTVSAGWPVALVVDVKDDCGMPFETGSVIMTFSTGEAPVSLTSLKGGRWAGTWNTQSRTSTGAVLKIAAADSNSGLRGERQISGDLQAKTDPPVFDRQGVVSAAAGKPFEALAPGSIISIYGERLASGLDFANSAPLPLLLLNTKVIMAGQVLPVYFVSPGQVNALVPFELNPNTTHQILIQQGITYSLPISVEVAPAQPAIFRDSNVSLDQGIVIVSRGQGQFEARPGTPAQAGDEITIYASGLGPTNPSVATGEASGPLSNTTNNLQLTIGGKPAFVRFAGLAPGFVGLYQVNAVVPDGSDKGDAIPVVLSIAGQTGLPATMAIQ